MRTECMRWSLGVLVLLSWTVPAGAQGVPQFDVERFDLSLLEPPRFLFAVISDTHVTGKRDAFSPAKMVDPGLKFEAWGPYNNQFNTAKFELVVRQINALKPAFAVHLGDIVTSWPASSTYNDEARNALQVLKGIQVPYYLTPGNHDVGNKWRDGPQTLPGVDGRLIVSDENEKLYKSFFGPVYHSWDFQDDHFIVLNMEIFNSPLDENRAQMEWLKRDLEEHRRAGKIFVFGHRTLYWNSPRDIGEKHYEVIDEPARSEILDLLNRYHVVAMFTGHTHHTIRNRHGATQLLTAPSTAFHRNTYFFYPAVAGGDHDPGKCGYNLVRVYNDAIATNLVRNVDVLPDVGPAQQGQALSPRRVLTKQSVESRGARLMLDVPLPVSTPAIGGPSILQDGVLGPTAKLGPAPAAWRTPARANRTEPVWILTEFEKSVDAHRVTLHSTSLPEQFTIETSQDGQAWVAATAYEGDAQRGAAGAHDFAFAPRPARFVKLTAQRTVDGEVGAFQLYELQVFGTDGVNYALAEEGGQVTVSTYLGRSEGVIDDNAWTHAWDLPSAYVRIASPEWTGWAAVERRPGVFRPSWLVERALANSEGQNVRYVMPLTVRHPLYAPGDVQAFAAYCRFLAQRFGKYISLWDLPRCTKDPVTGYVDDYVCPVEEYVAKFKAMREAIQAVQPAARFAATGLLAGNDLDFRTILEGIERKADLLGVVPGSQGLLGGVVGGEMPATPQLARVLDLLKKECPNAEVCVEYRPAALVDAPRVGAVDVTRSFLALQNRGVLTGLSLRGGYALLDDFCDPRQAYYALRLMATLFDGGLAPASSGPAKILRDGVVQWCYQRDGKTWLLAALDPWARGEPLDLQLPPSTESVRAYDPLTATSQDLAIHSEGGSPLIQGVFLSDCPRVFVVRIK